ncbi:putative G-protein coupled receptor F59B2.13 [Littorina saxatilis]|uniref:putative G-protein coupled receptor F59B2.13 n=1 Tax=Littorina saxatilis TaxID=31220 RepID=UPI0038B6209A
MTSMFNNVTAEFSQAVTTDVPMTSIFNNVSAAFSQTQGGNLTDTVNGCRVVDRQLKFLPWNNPDNVISAENSLLGTKSVSVFITLVCTLGAPLNIVNCIVFAKLGLRDRINFLLFSLACADFVSCVYYFLHSIEYTYTLFLGDLRSYGPLGMALTNSGANSMHGAAYVSRSISTLIACERCLCITHPFVARRLFRTRTTAAVVVLATVALMAGSSFTSSKFKIGCEYIPSLGRSVVFYYPSEFYRENSGFVDALGSVVFGLFLPFFFVVVTAITALVTIVKLLEARRWRQSTSVTMGTGEVALTTMLVALSCLFVACSLPNVIHRSAQLVDPDFKLGGRKQNLHVLGIGIVYVFSAINSSVNFFFYWKLGSRFRETLQSMHVKRSHENSAEQLPSVSVATK